VRDETVARSYATTLFELARRHEGLEAYATGIETVARLLDEDPRFRLFLETPRIADADKKVVVRKALGGVLPRQLLNFVLITIDKRRQRLLREISRELHDMVDEAEGRTHVEVTVARELDPATQEMLASRLSRLLGKKAVTHMRVKPEILGGVVVRAGDTIYDGSVRRRLDGMRRQMLKAPLQQRGASR
jgi:F-type H+-transporting ATPase subunit delta